MGRDARLSAGERIRAGCAVPGGPGVDLAVLGRDDPRYHAAPAAGGRLAATNPRHGLEAAFAQDGVTVRTGAGLLSLSLQSAGYGPALQRVGSGLAHYPCQPHRVPPRATHGVVRERAAGARAGLHARGPARYARRRPALAPPTPRRQLASAAEGNDVVFGRALRYRGLAAWDSAGRALPASLALSGHSLTLQIDDRGARYPVTIDPFLEQATLQAADGVAGDELGTSVAVSGDTIVVGAVADDGLRGSAYVFVEPGGSGWAGVLAESAKLAASDGTAGDAFGTSVAASGNTIVVGAYGDDGMRGAAYVFVKPPAGWAGNLGQNGKLTASVRAAGAMFGLSVGVDGDTAVAGAHGEAGGAAYVFVKPGTGWAGSLTQSARLTPAAGGAGTLRLGRRRFGQHRRGRCLRRGLLRGAVYVFGKPAAGWSGAVNESAKLAASAAAAGDGLRLLPSPRAGRSS